MKQLDDLLAEGLERKVYGAARAVVLHRGQRVYAGGTVAEDAVFDLASVTKVFATTALCCRAFAEGRLALEARVGDFLPNAASAQVTLVDLLFHRSGLPPFICAFADAVKAHPALLEDAAHPQLRAQVRADVLRANLAVAPTAPPRAAAVYSDIGFILLGAVLEQVYAAPLDQLFATRVAQPLGLSAAYRRVSARPALPPLVLSTGASRPREHAPGQEAMWAAPQVPAVAGQVDDDNAWAMDGVAGHAGLFSTAGDVARYGQAVLDGWLAPPLPWGPDALTLGSTRTLGFDTPSADAPSCGVRFGKGGGAIGHLGFTGTSLWLDLGRKLVVVLLTNRTLFGRANLQLKDFRPRFHDAVLDALGA